MAVARGGSNRTASARGGVERQERSRPNAMSLDRRQDSKTRRMGFPQSGCGIIPEFAVIQQEWQVGRSSTKGSPGKRGQEALRRTLDSVSPPTVPLTCCGTWDQNEKLEPINALLEKLREGVEASQHCGSLAGGTLASGKLSTALPPAPQESGIVPGIPCSARDFGRCDQPLWASWNHHLPMLRTQHR